MSLASASLCFDCVSDIPEFFFSNRKFPFTFQLAEVRQIPHHGAVYRLPDAYVLD